jgi:HlyD family secretion protein
MTLSFHRGGALRRKIILAVFLILFLIVAVAVYLGQQKARLQELYYSGTIESTQSELAFQVSGRVITVQVKEGQSVTKDQVLAELDRQEYAAAYEQARANLKKAEENLKQLRTVLDINRKILPADVTRAEAGVASAKDVLAEARSNKERYDQLYERAVVSKKEWEMVTLAHDTARARLTEAEAVLRQATGNLQNLESIGKQVGAAAAQVKASKAAGDLAEIQLNHTRLRAPYGGIITSRNVEPGVVVSPGRQVLTLSDLSEVKLKIFVGETEIGKVKPGQKVEVKVDTFPGKVYNGFVSYISPEGEFTPKIIQTQKERVKLVYLVQIILPNPDLELKSGMPADAWLK